MAVKQVLVEQEKPTGVAVPRTELPLPEVLNRLGAADRVLLERLIKAPQDFVDHPSFARFDVEGFLFGAPVRIQASGKLRLPVADPAPRDASPGESTTLMWNTDLECKLFLRLNYARMRVKRILEAHAGRRLTAHATTQLLAWYHFALELRGEIVRLSVPLVVALAKNVRLASLDFDELVSEGNMALLRSVDKFDCSNRFRFSTYLIRAILNSFGQYAIRSSRYRGRFLTGYERVQEWNPSLGQRNEEIEQNCLEELNEIVRRNLAPLTGEERTVIVQRFALAAAKSAEAAPKTLKRVGSLIGLSSEQVRLIQNKALRKLRRILEDRLLAA